MKMLFFDKMSAAAAFHKLWMEAVKKELTTEQFKVYEAQQNAILMQDGYGAVASHDPSPKNDKK